MRRTKFSTLVATGAFLLFGSAIQMTAQAPTGGTGGQAPSGNGSMAPQTAPQQPGMSPSDQQAPASSKVDDKKFLQDAAIGGMTEVELGKLAQQKASSPEVKDFGQKMVDDHTKANEKLKQTASQVNVEVPAALDSKHQARVDKLGKLQGTDFDKAYMKDQLKDHQMDVKEFSAEAQNGRDPKVKAFATATLPTLQHHLEMAKTIGKSNKEGGKDAKGQ